jgi:twinkle protein
MDVGRLGRFVSVDGVKYFEKCPLCGGVFTFHQMSGGWSTCDNCSFIGEDAELSEAIRNNCADDIVIRSLDVPEGLIDIGAYVKPNERKTIIPSGFSVIDQATNGFRCGWVTVFTGNTGEGKTTIVTQIALNVINAGYKVCVYSGETTTDEWQESIFRQAAGQNNVEGHVNEIGNMEFHPSYGVETEIRRWLLDRLFLSDNKNVRSNEQDVIFQRFLRAKHVKGCRLFIIDNLMSAEMDSKNEKDFNRQQSGFIRRTQQFAVKNDVHVILVAHPKKGEVSTPTDCIAGTANIGNFAATIFRINLATEKEKMQIENVSAVLSILKNRAEGRKTGKIGFYYDAPSKRLTGVEGKTIQHYNWETQD